VPSPLDSVAAEPGLLIVAALFGLVVGSFLNVVVHRVPRGLSVLWPASHCAWCAGPIRPFDNIPLLSYLWLRGRCRRCDAPIPWRYPALEGLTAAAFAAMAWRFPDPRTAIAGSVFAALLISLAAIDLEHFLLPDALTFGGIAAGLALQPWVPHASAFEAFEGSLAAAGALFLIAELWLWLRGEEGLGLGDAKMAGTLGAFLGWKGALWAVALGATCGAAVGLALIASRRLHGGSRIPFGFFLALGGLAVFLLGPDPTLGLLVGFADGGD
jgi:leader peptidase (prepilin peptidase)/N-methyltransferase